MLDWEIANWRLGPLAASSTVKSLALKSLGAWAVVRINSPKADFDEFETVEMP